METSSRPPCAARIRGATATLLLSAALAGIAVPSALAQKAYDPGATDSSIKIGNTAPYSGPASAYGTVAKAMAAYFQKVNDEGGVNGRKIEFVSLDDGYNPAKTVEATRKLVEQDEVLLMLSALGTAPNSAVAKYLNQKRVPQLFVSSGATRWGDYQSAPWTMGWQPTYQAEGRIYADHILKNSPNARIGVLYQNDDLGKDFLKGLIEGLGDSAKSMIVSQQSYEVTDPTVDTQIVALKSAGADTFVNFSTPKFAAMAIRRVTDIGWKPQQYLASPAQSISGVLKPAGFQNAIGVISVTYLRDPLDPRWKDNREVAEYLAWMKKYYPAGDPGDQVNVNGYSYAQTMVAVLKKAGDDLRRENIMRAAANLEMTLPMLYPGISLKTAPNDYYPIESMQPVRFNGTVYEPIGPVLGR